MQASWNLKKLPTFREMTAVAAIAIRYLGLSALATDDSARLPAGALADRVVLAA